MGKRIRVVLMTFLVFTITIGGMEKIANAENRYNRIWGNNRYFTAIEISKSGWVQGSEDVVLAYGEDYADALCAAPLAKQLDAPILLTDSKKLDKTVLDEIVRLNAKNVYLIGGTGVIYPDIENVLKGMGINCTRLFGEDRYKTSIAVADYMADKFSMSNEVVVATGDDFPDALSIASIAGIRKMPILLSKKSQLYDGAKNYMMKRGTTTTYIVGGNGVLSKDVEKDAVNPVRLGGNDRYETNITILNKFADSLTFNTTYIATGNGFADALAGSALAAANSSPIILVDNTLGEATSNYVADNRLMIKEITAIGGNTVVKESSIEPLLPKISSIADLNEYINENDNYKLPAAVKASMDNGTVRDMAVLWDSGTADTSKGITYTYKGKVKGYADEVTLKLEIMHAIMGKSVLTPEQMAKYLLYKNPNPNIACTPLELAKFFIEEGQAEGVRGDVAFAQSLKETNYFKFTGDAKPEWNNYCGLGVTGAKDPATGEAIGLKFNSPREGARAQIQHLKAYGSKEALNQECIDPRFSLIKQRGVAPYWEWLGKLENPNNADIPELANKPGWAPGADYGHSLISGYYLPMKNYK